MDEISAAVIHVFSLLQSEMTFQGLDTFSKGGFFSESAICYSNLQISKKIFQITILSWKFEFVVYYHWQEI